MGSSGWRAFTLMILILVCASAKTARGQNTPLLDELCLLPAPASTRAGVKAERDAQLRRAALAFDQDRYAESLIALRAAYATAPGADILFNMGQACLAAGRLEDSFALYSRAQSESTSPELTATITSRLSQLRPRLAKALALQAVLLGSQGKHVEACAIWSRAYELDPRPLYLLQLADALRQADKSDEALVLYERLSNSPVAPEIVEVARRRVAELRQPIATPVTPSIAPPPSSIPLSGPVEDPASRKNRTPIYRKWWFWTALIGGSLAVGLAVGLGTKAALDNASYPDLRQISF